MKTDNELIAEFMGWVPIVGGGLWFHENPPTNFSKHQGKFFFDTSWDWLMPVVEKILKTCDPQQGGYPYEYIDLEKTRIGNKIEYVYQRVVAYIKWYNSQKV